MMGKKRAHFYLGKERDKAASSVKKQGKNLGGTGAGRGIEEGYFICVTPASEEKTIALPRLFGYLPGGRGRKKGIRT